MIVAVASGKGGTGKTTIATSLALSLHGKVQVIDCDVEEPNAGLFLRPNMNGSWPVTLPAPAYDKELCTACGICVEACAFNALALAGGEVLIFHGLCHGCGGCMRLCPTGAIREGSRRIGVVDHGDAGPIDFLQGSIDLGEALSPPVIQAAKQHTDRGANVVIDCPPGTSCPLIAAVEGVDFCIVVTEPTPFGLHDLQGLVGVLRLLQIPFGVIINRSDLGDLGVDEYCTSEGIPVLLKVPFDRRIAGCISRGEPFTETLTEWQAPLRSVWRSAEEVVQGA